MFFPLTQIVLQFAIFSIPLQHFSANFHLLWPRGLPSFWSFSCRFSSPSNLLSRLQPANFPVAIIFIPVLENLWRFIVLRITICPAPPAHITPALPPILVPACHLAGSPSFPLPGQLVLHGTHVSSSDLRGWSLPQRSRPWLGQAPLPITQPHITKSLSFRAFVL